MVWEQYTISIKYFIHKNIVTCNFRELCQSSLKTRGKNCKSL